MSINEKAHDPVNHAVHYNALGAICKNCKQPIECIDVSRNLNFNLGNAIKYIWRHSMKNNIVEDIEKAIWYLQDYIKFLKERGIN